MVEEVDFAIAGKKPQHTQTQNTSTFPLHCFLGAILVWLRLLPVVRTEWGAWLDAVPCWLFS